MDINPLDDPRITSNLFFPRPAEPGNSRIPNTVDGTLPADGDVVLGYRLYQPEKPTALILYFHGNGEVAADHDGIVPLYFEIGAALLIVDYRGYGWSTGRPLTTRLAPDGDHVMKALPNILPESLQSLPKFVMGRSLGSAPAIYVAHHYADQLKGVIIESGFADIPSVFRRQEIPAVAKLLVNGMSALLPLSNSRRLAKTDLPLLVIHGERDTLLTIENGEKLYDSSPSTRKTFIRIPGAGHNDLLFYGSDVYFDSIAQFMREAQK